MVHTNCFYDETFWDESDLRFVKSMGCSPYRDVYTSFTDTWILTDCTAKLLFYWAQVFKRPGATLLFIVNIMYNTQKWKHKISSRYKRLGLTVVCCEPHGILTFTSFEFMNSCISYRHNETCEVGDLCKGVIRFCTKPQKSLLFCSKQFFL
jgi:hypothetical protein